MVCNVIENCRCFAYKGEAEQFCGVRKGSNVLPCPKDCCAGGCSGPNPFRFIDKPNRAMIFTPQRATTFILVAITVLILLLFIDLKITPLRKI
jgi:hypothetical protein